MEITTPPQNQTPAPIAPASTTTLITTPLNPPRPHDHICWQSRDGKVVIRMRVKTAKRHPPHDYPVIIVECHPNPFERIRHLPGGGVEAMFTHAEVKAMLEALVEADHKVSYTMTTAAAAAPVAPQTEFCWVAEDKQVVIRKKLVTATGSKPAGNPVTVVECHPREGTRIRELEGGGVEVMFTHQEVEELLRALSSPAGKVSYAVTRSVPPKSKERKERWRQFNADRYSDRRMRQRP